MNAAMRVLVTGATGFVGGAVARRLARDGHVVRTLARDGSSADALVKDGIDVVRGDVRDADAVRLATHGCSHVFHLAAVKSGSRELLHAVNVQGTTNVMQAASEAGVQRVVLAGGVGVYGFVVGRPLDESSPVRPNTPYRLSKWHAEIAARDAHERLGTPVVIARISSVVGRGARGWTPLARGILDGQMRLIGSGANSIDLVSVHDIVDGLLRCAAVPSIEGRLYVLGAGSQSTMAGFAATIAAALGVPAPRPGALPAAPFRLALHASALAFRHTGIASSYLHSREALVADKRVVSTRAREELGYDPRSSVEEAVRDMVAGYVESGQLARRGAA
jgi:nucleoside-diphosphate-sugar epimerase